MSLTYSNDFYQGGYNDLGVYYEKSSSFLEIYNEEGENGLFGKATKFTSVHSYKNEAGGDYQHISKGSGSNVGATTRYNTWVTDRWDSWGRDEAYENTSGKSRYATINNPYNNENEDTYSNSQLITKSNYTSTRGELITNTIIYSTKVEVVDTTSYGLTGHSYSTYTSKIGCDTFSSSRFSYLYGTYNTKKTSAKSFEANRTSKSSVKIIIDSSFNTHNIILKTTYFFEDHTINNGRARDWYMPKPQVNYSGRKFYDIYDKIGGNVYEVQQSDITERVFDYEFIPGLKTSDYPRVTKTHTYYNFGNNLVFEEHDGSGGKQEYTYGHQISTKTYTFNGLQKIENYLTTQTFFSTKNIRECVNWVDDDDITYHDIIKLNKRITVTKSISDFRIIQTVYGYGQDKEFYAYQGARGETIKKVTFPEVTQIRGNLWGGGARVIQQRYNTGYNPLHQDLDFDKPTIYKNIEVSHISGNTGLSDLNFDNFEQYITKEIARFGVDEEGENNIAISEIMFDTKCEVDMGTRGTLNWLSYDNDQTISDLASFEIAKTLTIETTNSNGDTTCSIETLLATFELSFKNKYKANEIKSCEYVGGVGYGNRLDNAGDNPNANVYKAFPNLTFNQTLQLDVGIYTIVFENQNGGVNNIFKTVTEFSESIVPYNKIIYITTNFIESVNNTVWAGQGVVGARTSPDFQFQEKYLFDD